MLRNVISILCISAVLICASENDESRPQVLHANRTDIPIVIDGILDEAVWKKNRAITHFLQRDPNEGERATQKTEVFLAYDDENLYVAAFMHDTAPDSIVARLSRRDEYLNSDLFGVYIDPYHDKRSGFYFGLSAAGTYYDGVLYNDDWEDDSWDGVWEGKAQLHPKGWIAEMRIPFSQLRFKAQDEHVWGINFLREISRNNEKDYLVYKPRNESGFVSRFVDLRGLRDIKAARNLEILPYFRSKLEYLQRPSNDPFNQNGEFLPGFGADIKYGITPNLTLDATINPDFGQVEVDPAVVNLSDVESFFQEKRPFFIEGSSIFSFGYGGSTSNWGFNWSNPSFFYSRRIGRAPQGSLPDAQWSDVPDGTKILGAAKVTGKVGNNFNVGTIHAVTSRERADLHFDDGSSGSSEVEPLSYYGIARAQKEFNQGRQGLGFISTLTTRSFDRPQLESELNNSAFAFGVDGWVFLDSSKTWVLSGWTGMSHVTGNKERITDLQQSSRHYFQRPDFDYASVDSNAQSMTGYAGRIALNRQKGNWLLNSAIGVIEPRFEVNDLGFLWNTNMINGHFAGGYRWTEPGKYFRRKQLLGSLFGTSDFDGNMTWGGVWYNFSFTMNNYYSFEFGGAVNPQTTNNRRTRGGPLTINKPGVEFFSYAQSDDRNDFVVGMGGFTYISSSGSRDYNFWNSYEWKAAENIRLTFSPEYSWNYPDVQWVGAFDDPQAQSTFGKRYIFAEMKQHTFSAGVRANITFTPELSFQMYMQPLVSAGDYQTFKYLAQSNSYDFREYGKDGTTLKREDGDYIVDNDGNGPAEAITFSNPDFLIRSLRGNAVLRWEYRPGSTLYLVWTQSRFLYDQHSESGPFTYRSLRNKIVPGQPDNIFLLKATYWLSL